ncbi:MAG TPA: efflux RND transporter periplasmic adaptor subunit [Candidatus Eisenbacteria bacterium]|jgi:membrane fusion protein (multidrug efflux system)
MPPTPVEVAEVQPRTVRDQFRAVGNIESDANVELVSELAARVVALPFTEGQAADSGALIARLDDREFRAEAERTQAQQDQAQSNYDRAKKLADDNLLSPQELEDSRTALRVAEAVAALARARFDKTRILAPFTGLVGVRRVAAGAYLREGAVITDLTRVDEMKVTFTAPERFAKELKPGVAVEIETPAFRGERFIGRLSVVDPLVDPNTRTLRLVARIPNQGRRLRPGMSADVYVTLAERSQALSVPDEAVFAEGNQNFVYVVKADSTVTRAAVELGTRDSMQVEVVKGLSPGVRVIRAGHQKVYEGARVMPIPSGGAPASQAAGAAGAGSGE